MTDTIELPAILRHAFDAFAEAMAQVELGAEHLNCGEAVAIENLLVVAGYPEEAACFIEYHAGGDDDIDDEHHPRYLEILQEHEDFDLAQIEAESNGENA